MSTLEIIPENLNSDKLSQARVRFSECVNLGKQCVEAERAWAKLGRLLAAMELDGDFQELGFKSMGACMVEIELLSGYSRASSYDYKRLFERAYKNGGDSVLDMRLGSARAFVSLPEHLQRDPLIQQAASKAPEEFESQIREDHPEVHLEKWVRCKFASSQMAKIAEAIELFKVVKNDPDVSICEGIEGICQSWVEVMETLAAERQQ
jgi:hypothetical protein